MPPLTNILKDGLDVQHGQFQQIYEDGDYYNGYLQQGQKRVLLRPGDVEGYNITVTGERDDADWWVYTRANDGFADDDRIYYPDGFHGETEWQLVEPQHSINDNLVLWRAREDDRGGDPYFPAQKSELHTTVNEATGVGTE